MRVMNRIEKYPNGYLPKIQFWEAKYLMALEAGISCYARGDKKNGELNHLKAKMASEKLAYFKSREAERVSEGVSIW
jgi:hypothetical protein